MYGLLIGASAVNLGSNLFADLTLPLDSTANPTGWVRLLLFISKPLIVPALAGILFLSTRGAEASLRHGSFYAALLFCWLGDIALLFSGNVFFGLGLGAFGVAHLFFIRAYLKGSDVRSVLGWKSIAYGLPFLVYGYTLYSIVYQHMDSTPMRLAVAGYMLVLLADGVSGFLRMRMRDTPSSASILVGVVLFVQSDSIIAVTEFVNTLPLERFAIMATYILGMFLLVRGCILDSQECASGQQPAEPPVRLASAA
jgi:uncharacterized membrane protein YhhN